MRECTHLNMLKGECYDRHTQTQELGLTFTPYAVLFSHIVSVYLVTAKKFSLSVFEIPYVDLFTFIFVTSKEPHQKILLLTPCGG